METTYLLDNYTTVKTGEPYRLFPFGKIVKNGKTREITPEFAAEFKLPHFKPAIKLGSHEDTTPAGGHMQSLFVRNEGNPATDGLWVLPEWNDKGGQALQDGAFRYHSPEVIWEDGALENPKDGSLINGPLILGDALLHTPHLGESMAMYSIETITGVINMEENITLPKSFYDQFVAPLFKKPEVEIKTVVPEDYEATKLELASTKAQIESQKAEVERNGRVVKFSAELAETKADPTLAELMADLPEDKAGAIMKQFRSLSEQINTSALLGEQGSEGQAIEDPKAAFNALVLKYSAEKKVEYNAAFEIIKTENAALFGQAFARKEK
jgi:hypothetical protein